MRDRETEGHQSEEHKPEDKDSEASELTHSASSPLSSLSEEDEYVSDKAT